jgi:hypothetical protein
MAENVLLKILQGIILTQNYRIVRSVDSICCTAQNYRIVRSVDSI